MLFMCSPVFAGEIDFLNIDIFGKSINEPIKILENGTKINEHLRPVIVSLDHNASTYYAAQVFYDKSIGYNRLVEIFSVKYDINFHKTEIKSTFGKNKELQLVIHIITEPDYLKVLYICQKGIDKKEYNKLLSDSFDRLDKDDFIPAVTESETITKEWTRRNKRSE